MAEKNVEDQFRDRLGSYEEDPAGGAWDFIEKELPPAGTPWYKFTWPSVILLLLLTTGTATWVWVDSNSPNVETKELAVSGVDNLSQLETGEKASGTVDVTIRETDIAQPMGKMEPDEKGQSSEVVSNSDAGNGIRGGPDGHKDNPETTKNRSQMAKMAEGTLNGSWITSVQDNQGAGRAGDKMSEATEVTIGNMNDKTTVVSNEKNERSTAAQGVRNAGLTFAEADRAAQQLTAGPEGKEDDDRDVRYFIDTFEVRPHELEGLGWDFAFWRPSPVAMTKVALTPADAVKEKKEKEHVDWNKRPTAFYAQFMPTFTYNRIETNRNDNQLIKAVEKLPAISVKRMGVRVETGVMHSVKPRLSVFAGALYFQRTQTIDYYLQTVDSVSSVSNGDALVITPGLDEEERSYDHQIQTLGIQLGGLYRLPGEKVSSSIGTGLELHRSLRKRSSDIFEEPSLYMFYNLFYRLEYPTDRRFRFLAQPTFNYSLQLSNDLNTPFYVKPYGFGLNFGFTFKL